MYTLQINGFEFIGILKVQILKKVNDHDRLNFQGIISDDNYLEYVNFCNKEIEVIEINEEFSETVFEGLIQNVKVTKTQEGVLCEISALSYTVMMDKEPKIKIYQNFNDTYRDILKNIVNAYDFECVNDFSQKRESAILQYKKTDWEFIKKIAELNNKPLIFNCSNKHVYMWIGYPERNKETEESIMPVSIQCSSKNKKQYIIKLNENLKIGDIVPIFNGEYVVMKSEFKWKNEWLQKEYTVCKKEDFFVEATETNFYEKTFTAKVINIEGEGQARGMIQVKFDIEDEESDNPIWINWITPYSAKDGGFYSMPEIGEKVNITIQDELCHGIYANGNVRSDELDINPRYKKFKALNKEILFDDKNLMISSLDDKIFLNMDDEKILLKAGDALIEVSNEHIKLSNNKNSIELSDAIKFLGSKDKIEMDNGIKMESGSGKIKISDNVQIEGTKINFK